MIFSNEFLFLHYPKTGGMMLSKQLVKKLKGKIHYTLPNSHVSPEEKLQQLRGKFTVLDGIRHENLAQASSLFEEKTLPHRLEHFSCILVIIRNPYDYIVSRFHYLKANQQFNKGPAARIAAEGNFRKYALEAPRFFPIEGYLLDKSGKIPSNMYIVRYEDISTQINLLLRPFLKEPIDFRKKVNVTVRKKYETYYEDKTVELAVYKKFKFLFDKGYYSRMIK